jgi:uncharacterized protein YdeI (YjbR/CyaY-like superfamily)
MAAGKRHITHKPTHLSRREFMDALARSKKANGLYKTLSKTNLYSIAYRLQTARRPETKAKRIELIVAMLARGETFH